MFVDAGAVFLFVCFEFFVYFTVFSPRIITLNERASRRAGAPRNSATVLYPDFLAHAFCARGKKFVESLQS